MTYVCRRTVCVQTRQWLHNLVTANLRPVALQTSVSMKGGGSMWSEVKIGVIFEQGFPLSVAPK